MPLEKYIILLENVRNIILWHEKCIYRTDRAAESKVALFLTYFLKERHKVMKEKQFASRTDSITYKIRIPNADELTVQIFPCRNWHMAL